ncbi:hypothetical protein [Alistipes sp.]|uniref:hypothetical protein n=1 Tax=Alistipes sp. TaxID=1872444 RepID=UPI003AF0EAAD
MKITLKKRTLRQMLAIERALKPESRAALLRLSKPDRVCGRPTPRNLNDLTIGELLDLQTGGDPHALVERIASVILKVHPRRCYRERADRMLGFVFWVGRELERIAALFASASIRPTPEEIKAGINDLDFGAFGLLDWYAHRQGYQDQDDAAKVAWVRVRECLRIDNSRAAFERRLREIIANKNQ